MTLVYRNGKWIDDAEEQLPPQQSNAQILDSMAPLDASPIEEGIFYQRKQQQAQRAQQEQQFQQEVAAGGDQRPFWAKDAGTAISDTGKILANAGISLGTDLADLVAGVGDVAVQSASAVAGNGFDLRQIMNDADNPWTQWRRESFKTESQAGQAVSNLVRIGVSLVAFPKLVGSGLATGAKILGGVDDMQKLAKGASGIAILATKLTELVTKADKATEALQQAPEAAKALGTVANAFQKQSGAARAIEIASQDKWLFATLKDVGTSVDAAPELGRVAAWADNVKQSTAALTQLGRSGFKVNIRTVGEALAWDAFTSFNVFGEGDAQFDETIGDMAASSNMPWLRAIGSPTATVAEDSGLVRKGKQMLEGLGIGIAMSAGLDMIRVYRYAKNFRNAAPGERALILEAMNVNAQDIGNSLGRTLVADGKVQGQRLTTDLTPQALNDLEASRQAANAGRRDAFLEAQAAREAQVQAQAQAAPGAQAGVVDLQAEVQKQPLYQQWQQTRQAPAPVNTIDNAAPAASDIPSVKVRSAGNQQAAAQSLMNWANAGLPESQWLVKSEAEALQLVQAKGASPDWNKITSVNYDAAANDMSMGRTTANTEAMRDVYARFYGIGGKAAPAPAAAAPAQAAQAAGPGTLKEYEVWLTQQAATDPQAAQALQQFKVMEAQAAATGQRGGQIVPFGQRPQAPTEGVPADATSPVQQRLAQMEGLASELNDDPLYQEWLARNADPLENNLPPAAPGSPALEQFRGQGPAPEVGGPPGPDDLAAYKAWLEANARMPDGELDPRVQQSLRRLEGIGELAPVPPTGALQAGATPPAGGPGLAGLLPGGPEAKPGGAPPAGLLGAGGDLVPAGIQPVRVSEIRPPEAVVSPGTIRSAFERDAFSAWKQSQELSLQEGADGVFRSITRATEALMPKTRVDVLEYLKTFHPAGNDYGVINAADSVWTNFIYDKALAEGWARIDPETMAVSFNRKTALQLDRGDLALKEAQQMDEIRYQEWLWNKELVNGAEQMRPEVQDNLSKMGARDQFDAWQAQQATERTVANRQYDAWEGRPTGENAMQADAAESAAESAAFDNGERFRLNEADLANLKGDLTDEQAVRELTGTTLDSITPPVVQKAEGRRGWEVYDRNGELLGSTTTKGAADKLAAKQFELDRQALIGQARQLEADAADQVLGRPPGAPVYNGDVMGKIQMTDAQIRALQGISPQLDNLLDDAWIQRRGGSAFFNVNELGPTKRTFELTQGDMNALQTALRSAIDQAGPLKGSQRLRALKNFADKLDVQMKMLEPQARAKQFADGVIADTKQYLNHGEFCDFF